jgi:PilZ domain
MTTPFIELPTVGSLLEVVLADGRAQSVRAVEVDGFQLTVAATRLAGGVAPPATGDLLTLRWVGRRGRCAAPCRVRAVHPELFATWTVEAIGTVEIEQRRRFARSAAGGRVHVGPDEPDVGVLLVGELIDIGEGGLRCRMTGGGVDPEQPVFIRLLLDDRLVTLRGTVLRLIEPTPAGGIAGGIEVVVVFQSDATQAQAIRRYVLARQLAERAVRADGAG